MTPETNCDNLGYLSNQEELNTHPSLEAIPFFLTFNFFQEVIESNPEYINKCGVSNLRLCS